MAGRKHSETHRGGEGDQGLRGWTEGLRTALALMVGVFPAGVAFGVISTQAGLSAPEALLVSGIIIAGASQFALVGLLDAGASALTAALTAIFLNLRHLLYGPTIAPYLKHFGTTRTAVGSLVLTDEVFAVAAGALPRKGAGIGWLMALEGGLYVSWLAGTLAGALGGATLLEAVPSLAPALGFALPALFVALLVSMLGGTGKPRGAPATVLFAAIISAGLHSLGFTSLGILAAGILAPVFGVVATSRGATDDGP